MSVNTAKSTETQNPAPKLIVKATNWSPLRTVFEQFIDAHPELGLKFSENTFRNFSRIHGPALLEEDVVRKPAGPRGPAIADITRFDAAAFDLISKGGTARSEIK